MAAEITNPALSAELLNKRIVHLAQYYKDRLRTYMRILTQDGIVGTVQPENALEEYQDISSRLQMLIQIAADPAQPDPARQSAQREYQRWFALRRQLFGQATEEPEDEQTP